MNRQEITPRQMTVWLAAAASAPLAHASGAGWLALALGALTVLPLTLLPSGWDGLGQWVRVVEFAWLSVVTGLLAQNSGVYWPASQNEEFVPLVLLVLAALTGRFAAPRVGAVIGLCLAVLYVPVFTGGAAQVEPNWLKPVVGKWSGLALVTFLLPALSGVWHTACRDRGRAALACVAVAILFGLLTQGILSPGVAAKLPDAFHQMSRSIRIGVLSRIEPLTAVAVTLGWYALCSFLLSAAMELAQGFRIQEKTSRLAFVAASSAIALLHVELPGALVVVLSLVLWVLVPICTCEKKNQKK